MAAVTLQPVTVDFYAGQGDVARVRVYYDAGFVSSSGIPIAASSPYGGHFYREVRCAVYPRTLAGGIQSRSFDIPALEVESTEDALDNPFATMSVWVCDSRGLLVGAYSDFTNVFVPPTIAGSSSYTWAQLAEHQAATFSPATPSAIETIQDTVAQMLRGSGGGTFPYDDNAGTLTIPTVPSPISGTGQAGRLAQWTDGQSLGNANVYVDSDGNYGFGVAAPLDQKITLPNNTYYGGLNPAGATARQIAGIDGLDRTIFGNTQIPTILRGDPLVVETNLRPDVPGTQQLGTPSAPFGAANLAGSLRLLTVPDGRLIGLNAPSGLTTAYDLHLPALPPSTEVVQVFSPSGQATWQPYTAGGKITFLEDGTNLPARAKVNFGPGLTAVDNPTNKRIDISLSANYQSVLDGAGATLPARPKLKFSNRFSLADEPGTLSTVVDLNVNYQTLINYGGQAMVGRGALKFGPGFTLTDHAAGYTLVEGGGLAVGETVNITKEPYNAVAGTMDCTAAINAALATGKNVFVPYGKFQHSGTLIPKKGQLFFGAGMGACLEYTGTGIQMQEPEGVLTGETYGHINVANLELTCTQAATVAIELIHNYEFTLSNVRINGKGYGYTVAGVHVKGTDDDYNSAAIELGNNCKIILCAGDGVRVSGISGVAGLWIHHCHIQGNGGWGVRTMVPIGGPYPASSNVDIVSNIIEANGLGQISSDVSYSLRIVANHLEHLEGQKNKPHIRIGGIGFSQGLTIEANHIGEVTGPYAVDCTGAGDIIGRIQANSFVGVGTAAVYVPTANGLAVGPNLVADGKPELVVGATAKSVFQHGNNGVKLYSGASAVQPTFEATGGLVGPVVWASASGSAAAPVFTRLTDLDTGIYFPAANTVGVTVGGSGRVLIDDALSLLPYGASAGQTGTARLYNLALTGAVSLRAHDTSSSYVLTLPANVGAAGQTFVTDASGNLGWVTAGTVNGTGAAPRLAFWSSASGLSNVSGLEWDAANNALKSPERFWAGTAGAASPPFAFGNDPATGMYRAAANTLGFSVGGNGRALLDDAFSLLPYGGATGQTGTLRLFNLAVNGSVTLRAHDTSAPYVLTFPANVGAVGQTFVTDASGNLSWVTRAPGHGVKYNGASLTHRPVFELQDTYGLQAVDTGFDTQLRTAGVMTGLKNVITDGGARGYVGYPNSSGTITTGTIAAGSLNTLTLTNTIANDYLPDNYVWIAGAGTGSAPHVSRITAVDGTGLVLTLATPAAVAVTNAEVRHDDSPVIQAWLDQIWLTSSVHITLPPRFYTLQQKLKLRAHATDPNQQGFYEARSVTIAGGGANNTHLLVQHGGSCFEAEFGARLDAWVIKDLSMVASVAADPFGAQGLPTNNRGHAIDLTGAHVVGGVTISGVRAHGFLWGVIANNIQGSWIENSIFRLCRSGGIAFLTNDTVWQAADEPNVNLIKGVWVDQSPYVNTPDITRTDGQMNHDSRILNSATGGFTDAIEGRIFRGYGMGVTGGDLVGLVKKVLSPTQLELSVKHLHISGQNVSGKTFMIEKVNCASVYFNRSLHTKIDSLTSQGNYPSSPQNVPAIRMERCGGVEITNLWVENAGGYGGLQIDLTDCGQTAIEGYRAHGQSGGYIRMTRSYGLRIREMVAQNPTLVLEMDETSGTVDIDNSEFHSADLLVSSFLPHPERVVLGDNVTFFIDRLGANSQSVRLRGTRNLYDAWYGEQWLQNPRFADGKTAYTDSQPTDWSIITGPGRNGTYALLNAQGQAAAGLGLVWSQPIPIPDHVPPGRYSLGYDYYIESLGATPTAGQECLIAVVGANGAGSFSSFKIESDNVSHRAIGRWQREQYSFDLGAGINRSFSVQLLSTRGPNSPRVRFANFRLQPGRHVSWSHDQPLTEYAGGTLRSHLRMVGLASAPDAPPTGSLGFYARDVGSGVIKLFTKTAAGVETEVGAGGGGITGTGNANVIAKWTGASAQGNSVMVESSGQIGIQTASPAATLHVNGSGRFAGDLLVDSANGRIWGINGLVSGHTVHFQYGGDSWNEIETAYGAGPLLRAYHGMTILSGPASVIGPALTVKSGQADKEGLRVESPSSPTADLVQFAPAGTFKSGISPAGRLKYDTSLIAASATAGSNGAVPSQVAGYLEVDIAGTICKIPYFNT